MNGPETADGLLRINRLFKEFDISGGWLQQLTIREGRVVRNRDSVKAINGVDLEVRRGEAFCLVGESGCGKSTVARTVMGLLKPTSGEIYYNGERIDGLASSQLKPYRRRMQMIFQNPHASLNPRMTVQQILEEPIRFHNPGVRRKELDDKITSVMAAVGVDPTWARRLPHEFSGGQRQRISIARALAVDPEFIAADEPLSALDVSVQAQVLNLLMEAQQERSLTYLFITHDLAVVEHFGSRVAVMYLGTVCEIAPTRTLFAEPNHPYTRALLSAIPRLDQERPEFIRLQGEVPTPIDLPAGCVFHGRCPHANDRCRREVPAIRSLGKDVGVACHAVEEGRI